MSLRVLDLAKEDAELRSIFKQVLEHHHKELAVKFDIVFAMSSAWCQSNKESDFEALEEKLEELKPSHAILMASAFSHMLNVHNLTERTFETAELRVGSHVDEAIRHLIKSGKTAEDIHSALSQQRVDLVFTAHPTQAMRDSVRTKYDALYRSLKQRHGMELSAVEKAELKKSMYASIQAAWRTDEIRRRKPTPLDEMLSGLNYVTELFDQVPAFAQRVDTILEQHGQPRMPLEHAMLRFGSWMGGDRDGNPNVKPSTTRDVVISSRLAACDLYSRLVSKLMSELSTYRCSAELRETADGIWAQQKGLDRGVIAEQRKRRNYDSFWMPVPSTEPFRCVLAAIRDKLYETREQLFHCSSHPDEDVCAVLRRSNCYTDASELSAALQLFYRSLLKTGDDGVANGVVLSAIRQVQTFGSSLMRLDIRQESTRHREVATAITDFLGMGRFEEWSEEDKVTFLVKELKSRRPLVPPGMPLTDAQRDVLDTFRVLAQLPSDSLGAYIISMAQTASDVLLVVLLQREMGVTNVLRVVPLFETLDDLVTAPRTMETLYKNAWYSEHIKGQQECMIGYSDSGKDAGRLAAAWALYQAQEALARVSKEHNVQLTLFHGRGGTVGRGGGPAHLAVLSQPPGTVCGSFRVTVQGETIDQQFGHRESALNTLDMYTASVLRATLDEGYRPPPEYRDLMQKLADVSCSKYRGMVHESEEFFRYFQAATPVAELGAMNIGSRPAKRKAAGGIGTLRAIPWIFAWTQTRFHLPVWLGVGEAMAQIREEGELARARAMYKEWPFFRVTVDMLAMVLAKADENIVKLYEAKLVEPELHSVGERLRASYRAAREAVLSIVGEASVLGTGDFNASTAVLASKLQLRAPYVVPLNILQAIAMATIRELAANNGAGGALSRRPSGDVSGSSPRLSRHQSSLRLWEHNEYADEETWALLNRTPDEVAPDLLTQAFKDTLIITIKGIAAGMQNTG